MAKLPHQSSVPPVDPQDGAIKSDGGAAEAIQTTTTDVVVSGASAPSTGQVLTAVDGVSANWQTPSPGGAAETYPILNSAMSFDGASNAASTNAVFNLPNDFTLESWIKPNSDHDFTIMSRHTGNWGNYTFFNNSDANLLYLWSLQGGGNQLEVVSFDLTGLGLVKKWTHFAVTRDGTAGEVKFYLNGIQLGATQASATGALDTGGSFELGLDGTNTRFLNGYQSEARIWNVVRTADEIRSNYTKALKGDEANLVAYFRDGFTDVVGSIALTPSGGGAAAGVAGRAGATVAHALEAATGIVSTQEATAPTTGQVLTATGGSAANWQTPSASDADAIHDNVAGEINAVTAKATPVAADVILIEDSADSFNKKKATLTDLLGGSSGPIAAAQGDYVHVYLGTSMTATLVLPQRVLFDSVGSSRGEASLDVTTNVGQFVNLKAGRTYLLQGALRSNTTTHTLNYNWYDITGAVGLGNSAWAEAVNSTGTTNSQPNAVAVFTPLVDSVVELRIVATNSTGNDIDAFYSYASVIEIGAVQADVVGGLEFMDIIEVTAAQTSVRFGASGDGAFQRALDGDADQEYICRYRIVSSEVSNADFVLQPNGVSTNQDSDYLSTSATGGTLPELRMGGGVASTDQEYHGEFSIHAKSGRDRSYYCREVNFNSLTNTVALGRHHHGVWGDDAAVITALDIVGSAALSIGPGSTFELFRRTSTNLRADSADTYERSVESAVAVGSLTTEQTTGHTTFGGSAIGLSVRIEEAVTTGTVTVNLKVGGATKLTAVLDTTSSTSIRVSAPLGMWKHGADENVSIEIIAASYDNSGSITSGITAVATLSNDAFILPPANSGETFIDIMHVGSIDSHPSATPKVVGQFSFDPSENVMAGTALSVHFRATASNGGGVASTNVQLYNLTDAESIAILNFTSASPVLVDTALTIGAGAGQIDNSPKIYEVRIYVDSPDLVDDTIELGSAELRIINTVN